jgi:SpoVK/Ycf46/Vps4 family AAA+-type ATPase
MVNLIADRTDIFPWELCLLFIDEIDGLAPRRDTPNASSHSINLLSVFLSVMDGNKKRKNLLVMGTSNRLAEMDEAFK